MEFQFRHKTKVISQYKSCCNVSPLILTMQAQLSTLSEELSISQIWHDAGDFSKLWTRRFFYHQGISIVSLYSQHILQPSCTAVPLTMTLCDAVQWHFVFTAHSTTLLYSCPAHYDTVWCCTVTVCIHSTFYNLTVQLSCSLWHCLMLYSDSLYSQHILQPYCTAVLLTTTLSDAVHLKFVFTAHSTTLLYSCSAHSDSVWCCTVTVCIHSTFYNLTLQLSCSLWHCLMVYCDSYWKVGRSLHLDMTYNLRRLQLNITQPI
jgi:hypothetical protein